MNPLVTLIRPVAEKLITSIFSNPWTSLTAVAATIALAVYYKQLSPQELVAFLVLIVNGLMASDGVNTTKETK